MAQGGSDRFREQLRHYLETGAAFSKLSRTELEELAREFLNHDAPGRERIEDAFEEIRARSRRGIDLMFDLVRAQVRREVEDVAARRRDEFVEAVEHAFSLFGDFFGRHLHDDEDEDAAPGRSGPEKLAPKKAASRKAAAKKAAPTKAPAKKAAAKKAPGQKASAKKLAAKKSAAKKSPGGSASSR